MSATHEIVISVNLGGISKRNSVKFRVKGAVSIRDRSQIRRIMSSAYTGLVLKLSERVIPRARERVVAD